ncbi:MAG: hypothetical protein CVV03_08330 [Firmicutes bacterium HGW-Firmicutes-8]|nr:MAG: hypothetical protein CVV03_08330 [Firmicutes bacterium HGW-Firmicutes-8]
MDRFFRGFVAGIIGGVIMNIWDYFVHYILQFTKLLYLDWPGMILFGHLPQTLWEAAYAQILQLLLVGMLGVGFAFFIPHVTSRWYLIKGVLFAMIAGFAIYTVPSLLRIPRLSEVPFGTVISNHIGGVIWGLVTAQMLRWLDRKQIFRLKINE